MHKILLRRARLASAIGISAALTLAVSLPARGLTFNMSYDRSVALAPAGLLPALTEAISSFSSAFSDSITLNIAVGWGEIAGRALSPGSLGQSLVRQPGAFTYGQVRMALGHRGCCPPARADVLTMGLCKAMPSTSTAISRRCPRDGARS